MLNWTPDGKVIYNQHKNLFWPEDLTCGICTLKANDAINAVGCGMSKTWRICQLNHVLWYSNTCGRQTPEWEK